MKKKIKKGMICPICGNKNPKGTLFCENCGQPLDNIGSRKIKKRSIVTFAVLILILGGILFLSLSDSGRDIVFGIVSVFKSDPNDEEMMNEYYQNGLSLMDSGSYEEAITEFSKIPNTSPLYDDAQAKIQECIAVQTEDISDKQNESNTDATEPVENDTDNEASNISSTKSTGVEFNEEIAAEAIKAYEDYEFYGACCKLGENQAKQYESYLTERQRGFLLSECLCCHSIDEVKSHLKRYMSEKMFPNLGQERLVEIDGRVFVLWGGAGAVTYDTESLSIYERDDGTYCATVDEYNSGDELIGEMVFDFVLIGDHYVINQVEDNSCTDEDFMCC